MVADTITYSTLIHGFCQVVDFNGALDIFREMISSGVCPNIITFRGMLAGLCSKEELQWAVAMLEDLQKRVVCPLTHIFSVYLLSFGVLDKNVYIFIIQAFGCGFCYSIQGNLLLNVQLKI